MVGTQYRLGQVEIVPRISQIKGGRKLLSLPLGSWTTRRQALGYRWPPSLPYGAHLSAKGIPASREERRSCWSGIPHSIPSPEIRSPSSPSLPKSFPAARANKSPPVYVSYSELEFCHLHQKDPWLRQVNPEVWATRLRTLRPGKDVKTQSA